MAGLAGRAGVFGSIRPGGGGHCRPTALNKATAALEAHTAAMNRMTFVGEEMSRQNDHLADELGRFREELRIHREIRRQA
jgi:hypothetical protein